MRRTGTAALCLLAATPALAGCDGAGERLEQILPTRSFTVSSTAMEPALTPGTTITAEKVAPEQLARGDIVVVRSARGENYVERLIGLPGETIALRAGVVIINGEPSALTSLGPYRYSFTDKTTGATFEHDAIKLREVLPGARGGHVILDTSETPTDDFGPITLGAGEYFVLGDNRDNSADSRIGPEIMGLGIVRAEQIIRRVELP